MHRRRPSWTPPATAEGERPRFDGPGELPEDMAEACESLKLAIVRHRLAGWTEVSEATADAMLRDLIACVHAS